MGSKTRSVSLSQYSLSLAETLAEQEAMFSGRVEVAAASVGKDFKLIPLPGEEINELVLNKVNAKEVPNFKRSSDSNLKSEVVGLQLSRCVGVERVVVLKPIAGATDVDAWMPILIWASSKTALNF